MNAIIPRACSLQADYSAVAGDRILPFVIALDTANSILEPAAGQLQRFCYTVTAKGADSPIYADLSHFVMGICEAIPAAALAEITVTVDGDAQTVIFGDNVELRTPENPDPPTGCAGLKFDFGLDKVTGVMQVCFSLRSTYPIGPIGVCLYGGGVTASGLTLCGPVCSADSSCPVIGSQRATVCVPVTVRPYARVGETQTYCCGEPTITPGTAICAGTTLGTCTFTISQVVCVAVPVTFGATATVGSYTVACGGAGGEALCEDCPG